MNFTIQKKKIVSLSKNLPHCNKKLLSILHHFIFHTPKTAIKLYDIYDFAPVHAPRAKQSIQGHVGPHFTLTSHFKNKYKNEEEEEEE